LKKDGPASAQVFFMSLCYGAIDILSCTSMSLILLKTSMDITLFAPSSKVDRANKKNWLIFLSAAKKVHDSLKITPP
jgi:hypothetical protein